MRLSLLAIGCVLATTNALNATSLSDLSLPSEERAGYRVVGRPEGFASKTTGGGGARCEIPADIAQLKAWLTDNVPRCIVIDKE